MKILGYEISEGKFKDIPYKNVILYLQDNEILKDGKGVRVFRQKVKYNLFVDFLNNNKLDWDYIVGLSVNVLFNRFGNVEYINLV